MSVQRSTTNALAPASPMLPVDAALSALLGQVEWPEGVTPTEARCLRVWAGRKERITCEYQLLLQTPVGTKTCHLQGVMDVRSVTNRRFVRRARIERGELRDVLVRDASGFVWCTPDRDPDMPAVRMLFREAGLQALLSHALDGEFAAGRRTLADDHAPSIISYRAGRRCVVRIGPLGGDAGGYILKLFRRSPDADWVLRMQALALALSRQSGGQVQIPQVVSHSTRHNFLLTRQINRNPAPLGYTAGDQADAARILQFLHAVSTHEPRTHTCDDELATVSRWRKVLDLFCAEVVGRLDGIVRRLGSAVPVAQPDNQTLIHRDFYSSQLLRSDGGLWMVDLDTVCKGDRELDLATYVAHAALDAVGRGADDTELFGQLRSFARAYQGAGGTINADRLAWYCACAWARLAAMHSARRWSQSTLAPLWGAAERILQCPRMGEVC